MIILVTGTPGAGKTLYTVSQLLTQYLAQERPLFVQGIPDLALPHTQLPPESEWTEHRPIPGNTECKTAPYYSYPENAVLVIDEAQNTFRPRPNGSRVPDIVQALETHRHTGIDIVLITQHPSRIDSAVKTLVGRHLHIRRMFGWARAVVYEWDCATDPSRVKQAITRTWSYPKSAFKLYKSSQLHTARGQRAPVVLILAILAGLAAPVAAYYFFSGTISTWTSDAQPTAALAVPTGEPASTAAQPGLPPQVPNSLQEALTPADAHNPLSAPLYTAHLPPVTPPQIDGCIASSRACTCYSQQQTPVWLPEEQCRLRAAGLYFDPYRQPMQREPEETTPRISAAATGAVEESQPAPASEMPSPTL